MAAEERSGAAVADDRFLLTNRAEISAILRRLSRQPEIVTAYFNRGRDTLVTAVLAVEDQAGTLILDEGPDEAANRRVLRAESMVCVTKEGQVSVKFKLGPVVSVDHEGRPAFRATIPDALHRLQRREYFRVPTPVTNPVLCHVGDGMRTHTLRVTDMSLGGIGVVDTDLRLQLGVHEIYPECQVELPGAEPFAVSLEVRNISRHILRDGRAGRRIGFAFRDLPAPISSVLQRYLQRLQIAHRDPNATL